MKNDILKRLKNNIDNYVSGEDLRKSLNVTRAAIWKHVKALKAEGYVIEASTKKGYRLMGLNDVLNEAELSELLETQVIGQKIVYLDSVKSTNDYAKALAEDGAESGTTVVAGKQIAGRGRLGREWSGHGEKDVQFSVILKPDMRPAEIQIITLAAAVATAEAIDAALENRGVNIAKSGAGIKWPNDILLNDKKVCGILTEMNCETDRINYLVVGIGINLNREAGDFAEDLKETATSLKIFLDEKVPGNNYFQRREVVKEIMRRFDENYQKILSCQIPAIIENWKRHSVTIGRNVMAIAGNDIFSGIAEDISNEGKLIVKDDDGNIRTVSSGEVSIRNTKNIGERK